MTTDDSLLVWDLRTYYANIVGLIITKLAETRELRKFPQYFDQIQDLYSHIKFKLAPNEIKEWDIKLKACIGVLQTFPQAFHGTDLRPEAKTKVLASLSSLHEWLYDKMNVHHMFGKEYKPMGI